MGEEDCLANYKMSEVSSNLTRQLMTSNANHLVPTTAIDISASLKKATDPPLQTSLNPITFKKYYPG